jgi:hypothetical protein
MGTSRDCKEQTATVMLVSRIGLMWCTGEDGKEVYKRRKELLIVCHSTGNSRRTGSGNAGHKSARNCPIHTLSILSDRE